MAFWNDYLILTCILGSLLVLIILYIDRKLKYWKDHNIPSPVTGIWTFLLQTRLVLKKPFHEFQIEMYRKYGPIHGLIMGSKLHLLIAKPELIKNIFIKDFNHFQNRIDAKSGDPIMDKMLATVNGEDWKRIRCIISPTFTSGRMRKMAYLMKESAEKFTKSLEKLIEGDDAIDCKKYFFTFTIDAIASSTFGTKLNSLDDPDNEFITNSRKITATGSSFLMLFFLSFTSVMRFFGLGVFGDGLFAFFTKFASHVIEQRDKNKIRGDDFLQLMLDAQRGELEELQGDDQEVYENKEHLSKTLTMEEMLAQCCLVLASANDSITSALSFFSYYMALYPDCQETLIKEIDEAWNKYENMTFDVLNTMPYLSATVNETLRLKPIGMQLMRQCTEDYELKDIGYVIPKGLHVVIPVYSMHHDPQYFPDPELFDPERFMPQNRSSIPQYAYLPFGEGPRHCIGMRFIMLLLKMCIVHLLKNFRIYETEETKKPLEYIQGQGTLIPKAVYVKFEKRNH